MNTIIVKIFILMLTANFGFAIQCYICESPTNSHCDPLDNTIQPQECNIEALNKRKNENSWLDVISGMPYQGIQSHEPNMECQKIIGFRENGERSVLRTCQLEVPDSACNLTMRKLNEEQSLQKNYIGYRIESCTLCKSDSCNGSTNINPFNYQSLLLITIGLIGFMKLFS